MKVCFVYAGPLKYRGRLFKQIKTLQDAGIECLLVHGWTEEVQPDYSVYSFPVIPIKMSWGKSRLLTLTTMLRFNYLASDVILESESDTVICITLESALSGALVKKRRASVRFIFDCNELALEMFSSRIKKTVFKEIQSFVLRYADVVMHAERNRLDYFKKKYPSRAQTFLLENLPVFRQQGERLDTPVSRAVYLGVISPDRHCTDMFEAFSELNNPRVQFDLIGFCLCKEYEKEVQLRLSDLNANNVRLLPPVAHDQICDVLADYQIGLAFYQNTDLNNYFCAPNKVYDYIQMGMAVITNDYPGLKDIVEKNRIGVCLSDVNVSQIQSAVRDVIDLDLRKNIHNDIRYRYSWEYQRERYLQLISFS